MPAAISPEKRKRVIELYIRGYSYREIDEKTGVSIGSISEIINEKRKEMPDIDDLRGLSIALRESNASLLDTLRGANCINKCNELNISVEKIPNCFKLLENYGEKAGHILEAGIRIQQLEEQFGRSYEQLTLDFDEKTEKDAQLSKRVEELSKEERKLKSSLGELSDLRALKDKIEQRGLSIQRLDNFIEKTLKLEELGFTLRAAELLSSELSKRGLDIHESASLLAAMLALHVSLEDNVSKLKGEVNELNLKKTSSQMEIKLETKEIEKLQKQHEEYKNALDELKLIHKVRIDALEKEYQSRKSASEAELSAWHSKQKKYLEDDYNVEFNKFQKAKEKLGSEIANLEKEIKGLEDRLGNLKKECMQLEEKRSSISDQIFVTGAISSYLNEPIALNQEARKKILGYMQDGLRLVERGWWQDVTYKDKVVKDSIITVLRRIVKDDVIPAYKHTELQSKHNETTGKLEDALKECNQLSEKVKEQEKSIEEFVRCQFGEMLYATLADPSKTIDDEFDLLIKFLMAEKARRRGKPLHARLIKTARGYTLQGWLERNKFINLQHNKMPAEGSKGDTNESKK